MHWFTWANNNVIANRGHLSYLEDESDLWFQVLSDKIT